MVNAVRLGRDLAARRRAAGLKQSELAQRMGTTQAEISRIENGRTLPSLTLLDRYVACTGGPFALVLGYAEPVPSREEQREQIERVLPGIRFDPWARNPSPAEAASLNADGLTRERFEGAAAAR